MSFHNPLLDASCIGALPSSGFYIPNFITSDEEQAVISAIAQFPLKHWTVLTYRRLLSLPSQLTGAKRDTLIEGSLPAFLADPIAKRIEALEVFQHSPHAGPNHCLVNEYNAGQGIMPHEDGPAYYPITATVSLGSHTVLNIYEKNEHGEKSQTASWRLLQEPRSLLITTDDMYRATLHGIDDITVDTKLNADSIVNWNMLGDQTSFLAGEKTREKRLSLTYRDVLKVTKLGGALKLMTRR